MNTRFGSSQLSHRTENTHADNIRGIPVSLNVVGAGVVGAALARCGDKAWTQYPHRRTPVVMSYRALRVGYSGPTDLLKIRDWKTLFYPPPSPPSPLPRGRGKEGGSSSPF